MIFGGVDRWLRFLFLRLQLKNQTISIGGRIASSTIGTTMTAVNSLLERSLLGAAIDDFACSVLVGVGAGGAVEVDEGIRDGGGRASTVMAGPTEGEG